jgi:hypothetical protein
VPVNYPRRGTCTPFSAKPFRPTEFIGQKLNFGDLILEEEFD